MALYQTLYYFLSYLWNVQDGARVDAYLESAIPCENQAEKWTEEQRDRYYDIAAKCDKETMIQRQYTPDCMHKRNRYMVDQADFIIAVWDGRPSGTGKTVQYAQRQGKPIVIINPKTQRVEKED